MTLKLKKYYAYSKTNLEHLDICYAFSRLDAAKIFSKKKHITLLQWIKIYTCFDINYVQNLLNNTIYIYKNTEKIFEYFVDFNTKKVLIIKDYKNKNKKHISLSNLIKKLEFFKKDDEYSVYIENFTKTHLKQLI